MIQKILLLTGLVFGKPSFSDLKDIYYDYSYGVTDHLIWKMVEEIYYNIGYVLWRTGNGFGVSFRDAGSRVGASHSFI